MPERGRDLKTKAIVAVDALMAVLIGAALVASSFSWPSPRPLTRTTSS
jgi:hypothetical protein